MPLTITNTFTANTTAKSAEVNTNFTDVKTWIDARLHGSTGHNHQGGTDGGPTLVVAALSSSGQTSSEVAAFADGSNAVAWTRPLSYFGLAQCRLEYQSATQVRLNTYQGQYLDINGKVVTVDGTAAGFQLNTTDNLITATGADAAAAMAASTLYYVYESNSSATTFPSDLRASATAPTAYRGSKYLAASGNGANWRFVGYVYPNSSTNFVDSATQRLVRSADNPVLAPVSVIESTDSWTYTTATWRSWNNSTANRIEFISDGVRAVSLEFVVINNQTTATNRVPGIGLDSTSANSAQVYTGTSVAQADQGFCRYNGTPAEGYHYLQLLEYSVAAGTTTWYGDAGVTYLQSGATGFVWK